MKVLKIFAVCIVALLTIYEGKAQLTKPFSSIDLSNNTVLTLEGDKNTSIVFRWTDANLYKPGVVLGYSLQFDSIGGSFNNPLLLIGGSCCATFFKDTTVTIPMKYLADQVDVLYKKLYNKGFTQGESIVLEWVIQANASGPNATYENRATAIKRITIVRGQFLQEYVPVKLLTPLDNSSFFVEDNATVKLKFQWTKAYCPGGCNAAQYTILFDSMGGNFSKPIYFSTIPQSPFDTLLDLRQDILAQMMYDDGVPSNVPKTYKWTVKALGNSEEIIATPFRKVSLLRGLMRFENTPFFNKTPVDNAVFKLEKNKNDSIIFSWNKTQSGFAEAASYTILFDTALAKPNFITPLFTFKTTVGDTDINIRYLALRDSIDKKYSNWKSVGLKWTIEANINGYKFMGQDTSDILIARGFFNNINKQNNGLAKLYPNPVNTQLNIAIQQNTEILYVEICDMLGRIMGATNIYPTGGHLLLDVAHLPNGVYFVRLQDIEGNTASIPFIKQ